MTKRPGRGTGRGTGLPRAAAITAITLTALATGPAAQAANAREIQDIQQIPVIQIQSPARLGVDDTTLANVAQLTLGNPGRANEIFQLNVQRPQKVGGELTSPDQRLEVGWILELPQDASGSLVQSVAVNGTIGPSVEFIPESSSVGYQGQGTGSSGTGSSGTGSSGTGHPATMLGLKFPVFLAELGGLLLLGLTLLILLLRRAKGDPRKGSLGGRVAAWFTESSRARREREIRAGLSRAWRADSDSTGLARAALAEAGQAIPPAVQTVIAADVRPDSVSVFPVPDLVPPRSWQAFPGTWTRQRSAGYAQQASDPMCRPVRVGGDQNGQLFVDISHCDGAIALTGDTDAASEVLLALLGELGAHHPDLYLAVLGTLEPGPARVNLLRHSSQLASLISPVPPVPDSPVRAAATRRLITSVVAVPAGTPDQERFEAARLCALRGSTCLALVVGDVPGAHWRWDVDQAGHLRLPTLGRTVVAPL